jgi:hypothetical protein
MQKDLTHAAHAIHTGARDDYHIAAQVKFAAEID